MAELFKGQAGSPITHLISAITASQTTITIADANALPDAPNICTLGFGDNLETIRYGVKTGGSLGEITRGIEGTPRAWPVGSEVARFFTAYDHQSIVEKLQSSLSDKCLIVGRDTNTPGTQKISLGFKPRFISIHAFLHAPNCANYESDGAFDGLYQGCIFKYGENSVAPGYNYNLVFIHSGGAFNSATAKFLDDGFELEWSVTSSIPTGSIAMKIEVS